MKFIKFNVNEEEKINEFLKENEDKIDGSGIRMVGDSVCILYSPISKEESFKKSLIAGLEQEIFKCQSTIAIHAQKEELYRDEVLRSDEDRVKLLKDLILNSANQQRDARLEIKFFKETIERINSGDLELE